MVRPSQTYSFGQVTRVAFFVHGTENEGGQGNGEGEGGEEEGNPEGCTSESRTGEDGVEEVVIRCPRPSSGGT